MVGMNNVQTQRRAGLSRNQPLEQSLLSTFRRPAGSENGKVLSEDTRAANVPVPRLGASANGIGSSVSEKSSDTFIPQFTKTQRDEEYYSAVKKLQNMSFFRFQSSSDNGHDPVTGDIAKSKKVPNDDDPPMSSSDDDDDDNPLSHRGDIHSDFMRGQQTKKTASSAPNGDKITTSEDEAVSRTEGDGSGNGERNTRASASSKRAYDDLIEDDIEGHQPQKKPKTQTHKSKDLGSHLNTDMDAMMEKQWGTLNRTAGYRVKSAYKSKAKASATKTDPMVPNKNHIAAQKQRTPTSSTKPSAQFKIPPKAEIPERPSPKLRLPKSFGAPSGDQASPTKKPKEKGKIRRAKPPRKPSRETGDMSSAYDLEDDETLELGAADTTMLGSTDSPLSSLDSSTFETSRVIRCPICDEELDEFSKDELKARRTRMTLHQEQQFCQSHKKRSAKKEWEDRGYPDIDWTVMDKRIRKQNDFIRFILNGGKSYYANVFSDRIKSGQNKTLMKSDANLTPGYYGMRGLRVMSEHIVNKFSAELRKRAVQDRLVSARGYMVYVQSVLVPELAVRLIMEDKEKTDEKLTAEQARTIMKDSIWIGELLNEEDADHVLYEDEEEDEIQAEEMGLGDEDETHLEDESKVKHEDQDSIKHGSHEEEKIMPNDHDVIDISDNDKVKSDDQNGANQDGNDIKSNGNGTGYIMYEDDDDSSLSSVDPELCDI
ncbi:RTC4-like domain-containing protein [Sordaria sp. MPI-SDFR-AT-0083]|nr:RTC4-like domain-containing protein [Sordaria sp. MPI-SDFR-AT-0083]